MSLTLDSSTPEKLMVKTCGIKFEVGEDKHREQVVMIGDYEIPMSDFCTAVHYVITNTDLDTNDPRIGLVASVASAKIVPGFNSLAGINPNCLRFQM